MPSGVDEPVMIYTAATLRSAWMRWSKLSVCLSISSDCGNCRTVQPATLSSGGRLAMFGPMMMPAGRYGRTVMQELGVWNSVKGHVANAANAFGCTVLTRSG
jgi:ABC-type molybdate transport system substrate-binding protein